MRRINTNNLKNGMVISKAIYSSNGIVLLGEGVVLTERYIEKIIDSGLEYIFIEDELSAGIEAENIIKDETKIAIQRVLIDSLQKMKMGCFTASTGIVKQVEKMMIEILSNPVVMISVQEIRNKSDYALMHVINVSTISCLMGKNIGLSDEQLKQLTIGALLHDLGKVSMDINAYKYRKEYSAEEYEVYKMHTENGYRMIQEIPCMSLVAANVARTHHENYDGTGFPLGLAGDKIHLFSRIVAIANEYDNRMYNTDEKNRMKHHQIIEYIIYNSYTMFDPEIVKVFTSSISPFPLGSGVILSNNKIGIVAKANKNVPSRPIVHIINPETREILEEIDLSVVLDLTIVDEKSFL